MSKYTTELRFIVENFAGLEKSIGYNPTTFATAIEAARPKIFGFDYPIHDASYKKVLETKIIKHFFTREIGFETVALFLLKLDTKMNEIMPFYNQLYKSAMLEFNPFYDVDLTTTHKGTEKNDTVSHSENTASSNSENGASVSETGEVNVSTSHTGKSTSTETAKNKVEGTASTSANNTDWDLYSDTPQGRLSGVEENNYLTNARKKTNLNSSENETATEGNSSGSTTANDESKGTEKTTTAKDSGTTQTSTESNNSSSDSVVNANSLNDYITRVSGKTGGGSYSKALLEFRETMLNIDMQIINDLKELFLNLY